MPTNKYIPGKSIVVAYKLETGTITESTDGIAAATLPALTTSPTIIGYTNQQPQSDENFNPKKGRGGGSGRPLYDADGDFLPESSFQLAFGSAAFLQNCCLIDQTTEDLPYVALYFMLKGYQTIVHRFAKCADLGIVIQPGSAQEGMANVRFPAISVEYDGAISSPTISQIKAVGTPLFYGDVRQTLIQSNDLRQWFGGMTINVTRTIEPKNSRPNFGQDQLLANTPYELLVNDQNVSGNLTFHSRLDDALFRGSATARLWGDVGIPIKNLALTNIANLTVKNLVPQTRRMGGGGEVTRQISHTIPFLADDLLIASS